MQQFILRKLITSTLLIMLISSNASFAMKPTFFYFGEGSLQPFNSLTDVGSSIINGTTSDAINFGQTNKQNYSAVKKLGWENLQSLNNDPHHNLTFLLTHYVPIFPVNIRQINLDNKKLFSCFYGDLEQLDINKQYILAISPCRKNFYPNLNDAQKNDTDLWQNLALYEENVMKEFINRKKMLYGELIKQNKVPVLKIYCAHANIQNGQPLTNQLFFCKNENEVNDVLNKCEQFSEKFLTEDKFSYQLNDDYYWDFRITLLTLIQYPYYKNNALKLLLKKANNVLKNTKSWLNNEEYASLIFSLLFHAKEVNNLEACYQLIEENPFGIIDKPLVFYPTIRHSKQILDLLIENDFDENILRWFRACGGRTNQETNENGNHIMNPALEDYISGCVIL
jgi:hypothetical protein